MVTSMGTLLRTEPTDEFRAISGMKVLSMFLVIMGHRVMISSFLPYINQREMQQVSDEFFNKCWITNNTLIQSIQTVVEITTKTLKEFSP